MNSADMNSQEGQITRVQHLIPATVILVLALSVAWLSFTREPAVLETV